MTTPVSRADAHQLTIATLRAEVRRLEVGHAQGSQGKRATIATEQEEGEREETTPLRETPCESSTTEKLTTAGRSCCAGLDCLLPERGFPQGTLVEWLAGGEGSGVGMLAMLAAQAAATRGGELVVFDRERRFYPPAAAALGVDLRHVIVVRASDRNDELWGYDQALRCTGVAAVWGVIDKLSSRWFRRLQLAAEKGGGIGHLLRPAHVRGQPAWSYAQLWVEPLPSRGGRAAGGRRWRVELARCHGTARGGVMEVELDELTAAIREPIHETRPVHLAPQLAYPTSHRRSARA